MTAHAAAVEHAPAKESTAATPARANAISANRSLPPLARFLGNQAVQQFVQAKLSVSQPHDPEEEEADRLAESVVGTIQRKCAPCESGGTPCAKCEGEEEKIARKEKTGAGAGAGAAAAPQVSALQHGGQRLPPSVRGYFEPRFNADFSGVRVHTGRHANEMTDAIHARAFTLGKDVVFGAGEWAPETREGRLLLAHELAHVIQQRGGIQRIHRKTKVEEAIEDRDVAKIADLHHSQLQLASTDQKIAMIGIILEQGGPTHRLDILWQGVDDATVEANIGLWQTTWESHAASMSNHPRKSQFERDVEDVTNAMLTESEAACDAYLEYYGMTASSAEVPPERAKEREQSVSSVQRTAVDVLAAQTQLKRLYSVMIQTDIKYLGYGSNMKGFYPFMLDVEPMYASPEGMELWKKTNAAVKDLNGAIDAYLEAYPELYPIVMGGQSSKRGAYTDPTRTQQAAVDPKKAIEQGLRETIQNIKDSRSSIRVLARDRKLGPVEQQLLSGARTASANRNWKTAPVWSTMAPAVADKGGSPILEGALMLGVQIALALTTGGIGNLLMSAAQVAMSQAEASVLQTASDTSLGAKTAIVSKQEVAAAKLMAAVDAAFLIFDIVPGVKQARSAWSTARGSAHAVEAMAAEIQKKSLQFEARMMQKAEKAELDALRKSMQAQVDAAATGVADARKAAANASEGEKVLAEAEVRRAQEALARAQADVAATKALEAGEALVADIGGRRYSWVPGRGLAICASPCAYANVWFQFHAAHLLDEAAAQSPLAADMLRKRIDSAAAHIAQLESMLQGSTLDKAAFDRAVVHTHSIIGEVEGQYRFALARFGDTGKGLGNKQWAEMVMRELRARQAAILKTDEEFFGSLGAKMKADAVAGHTGAWESTIGKVRDPAKPTEKLKSFTKQLEDLAQDATVDGTKRDTLLKNIDLALTNFERELRGQRELVLGGAEMKVFTDEAAGELIYGLKGKALEGKPKPDYIAETPTTIIIGDSKGAGDVPKASKQIQAGLDSDYVKNSGKAVEVRVYLDATEAAANGYMGIGHPPVLHQLIDGKYVEMTVSGHPLHVVFN
jgi:uncharacterized protein DUF4157